MVTDQLHCFMLNVNEQKWTSVFFTRQRLYVYFHYVDVSMFYALVTWFSFLNCHCNWTMTDNLTERKKETLFKENNVFLLIFGPCLSGRLQVAEQSEVTLHSQRALLENIPFFHTEHPPPSPALNSPKEWLTVLHPGVIDTVWERSYITLQTLFTLTSLLINPDRPKPTQYWG